MRYQVPVQVSFCWQYLHQDAHKSCKYVTPKDYIKSFEKKPLVDI